MPAVKTGDPHWDALRFVSRKDYVTLTCIMNTNIAKDDDSSAMHPLCCHLRLPQIRLGNVMVAKPGCQFFLTATRVKVSNVQKINSGRSFNRQISHPLLI